MSKVYEKQLVRITEGEWAGETWRVRRVFPTLIELQRPNEEGLYQDFCSLTPDEFTKMTRPEPYCPVDFGHHLGMCCTVCGNDERKMGAHLPINPDLTDEDRARFARKDEIFAANWG